MLAKEKMIVIACLLTAVLGYADAADYSSYVKLNKSGGIDSMNSNSWNQKGKWSDSAAPSSTKNYYVPSGSLLYFKSDANNKENRIWKGGQLAVAGTFVASGTGGDANAPFVADLVLCAGGVIKVPTYGPFSKNGSEIVSLTVEGTADNPSVISHQNANSNQSSREHVLNCSVKGGESNVLVFERPEYADDGNKCFSGWTLQLPANLFDDYCGTFEIKGDTTSVCPYKNTTYSYPQTAFAVTGGANFQLYHKDSSISDSPVNAYLRLLTVSGSKIQYGYTSDAGYYPAINVSEGVSIDADSEVWIPGTVRENVNRVLTAADTGISCVLFRLAETAPLTTDDLSSVKVVAADDSEKVCPLILKVVKNVDGGKDVVLSLPPDMVVMKNTNSQSSNVGAGAFDAGHENNWSDGKVPTSDSSLHYWLNATAYFPGSVNLPNARISIASLVFCTGGSEYKFKEINFCGGDMDFNGGDDQRRTVKADKINVYADTQLYVSNQRVITWQGELCGDGDIVFRNNKDAGATMFFTGKSTNYTGRVTITQRGEDTTPNSPSPQKFQFYLSNGSTFNGKYSGDDWYRSITFSKYPILNNNKKDVVFAEPTRGILVQEGVYCSLGGGTVTISNQVTFAGKIIIREGVGTLDLAGSARFIDGNADTPPEANANVVEVQAGNLRISSKTAADGLAISFAEGAKLLIPADTKAGYYNVKWDAPLTINSVSGKLPVTVENLESSDVGNVVVPICTFNAAAAANISEDVFMVSSDADDMRFKSLKKVVNDDTSVSYMATFGRFGSRIVIR